MNPWSAGFSNKIRAAYQDMELVGEAATGYEAIVAVERLQPDIVVMHIRREAAMMCEQCHVQIMIERPPIRQTKDPNEEQAIVLECPQCGHTEYQPLITSFWAIPSME